LFERLERPVVIEEGEEEPENQNTADGGDGKATAKTQYPDRLVGHSGEKLPDYQKAIETLFDEVRPPPEYGREERRLA
jgi:hypothetical protein